MSSSRSKLRGETAACEMAVRVVIAEDEWLAALVLRHQLEAQGYEVVGTVRTGRQAVALCARQAPDVVFMDVQMPQLDGLSATRALMERCPTCVVIVTGRAGLEEAAQLAGAMHYVPKPLLGTQIPEVVKVARDRFAHFLAIREESATLQEALDTWQMLMRVVRLMVGRDTITEGEAFREVEREALSRAETLRVAAGRTLRRLLGQTPSGTPAVAA